MQVTETSMFFRKFLCPARGNLANSSNPNILRKILKHFFFQRLKVRFQCSVGPMRLPNAGVRHKHEQLSVWSFPSYKSQTTEPSSRVASRLWNDAPLFNMVLVFFF